MKNYSVSLVYTKQENGKMVVALRCCICSAISESKAFGIVVKDLVKEMDGYSLANHIVLDIVTNMSEASGGLPLGEDVPAEDAPPEHIFNEDPEADDLETVFPKTKVFHHTDKYMREHNNKMNAKKSKSVIKPEPKYFSDSTQEALYEGKGVALPGVQATPNKFIVQNTYFQGRLDQVREQYNKYFNDIKVINNKLGEKNWLCTLTWESWLSTKYVANHPLERKIDVK